MENATFFLYSRFQEEQISFSWNFVLKVIIEKEKEKKEQPEAEIRHVKC